MISVFESPNASPTALFTVDTCKAFIDTVFVTSISAFTFLAAIVVTGFRLIFNGIPAFTSLIAINDESRSFPVFVDSSI